VRKRTARAGRLNWLLDFDETLASGNITWALKSSFPKLIKTHNLPYERVAFETAVLRAQERSSSGVAPLVLLDELFSTLGWPRALEAALWDDLMLHMQPSLYDDALQFLHRLREKEHRAFIVSNNALSPQLVSSMGLQDYVSAVFTPKSCPGTSPKPDVSLWTHIRSAAPEVNAHNTVVVGDDPWSDGAFAAACSLPCWIVDRHDRFASIGAANAYGRVRSLSDIPLF
jgi:FMN phosphatase YigB (HAD superfamily)